MKPTDRLAFTPGQVCDPIADPGVAIGTQGGPWGGPIYAQWSFFAPAGTTIEGVNFQRNNHRGGGLLWPLISICSSGVCNGVSDNTAGWIGTQFGAGGWTSFHSFIGCSISSCSSGGWVYVSNLQFTMSDSASPVVTSLGGSLLAGGVRRGSESLSVRANDAGAGLRSLAVTVNGATIESRTLGCALISGGISNYMRPCGNANEAFSVNTEGAPWVEGQNTLEVCASDFAAGGNANVGCAQTTVVIDNSCPTSAGAPQATAIDAALQEEGEKSELSPSVSVRSDEGATVRGQLSGPRGPVGGANVCLYEKIDVPGDIRRLAQTTKTKSDGTFGVQVEPGPSRQLDVVYRFNNQVIERAQLYLDSSVKPELKMKPKKGLTNGETTGFFGEIPGPNQDSRGVSLQAKAGKKWRTFKQIKTNSEGKFRGRYKFNHTRGRVTYKFRARVKRQGGYPYSPGSSAKRKVRVRG